MNGGLYVQRGRDLIRKVKTIDVSRELEIKRFGEDRRLVGEEEKCWRKGKGSSLGGEDSIQQNNAQRQRRRKKRSISCSARNLLRWGPRGYIIEKN